MNWLRTWMKFEPVKRGSIELITAAMMMVVAARHRLFNYKQHEIVQYYCNEREKRGKRGFNNLILC